MAILIPIESIDLRKLRRIAEDRRRDMLISRGFTPALLPPPLPLEPIPTPEPVPIEPPRVPGRVPTPPPPQTPQVPPLGQQGQGVSGAVPTPTPVAVPRRVRVGTFERQAPPPGTSPEVRQALEAAGILESSSEVRASLRREDSLRILQEQINRIGVLGVEDDELKAKHFATIMAPLDVFSETVAELLAQIPKALTGNIGDAEAPTLFTEGFMASLRKFRDRPMAQQIVLGFLDPFLLSGAFKLSVGITRAAAKNLIQIQITKAAPNLGREAAERLSESITQRLTGPGLPKIPPQGVVRASDNPGLLVPKPAAPLTPIAGGAGNKVSEALDQAESFRTIDSPGFVGGAIDKIPGVSHIQRYLRPANKLPPKIQNAWVAAGGERAAFLTDQFPSRSRILQQIDDIFGARTVDESGRHVPGPSPVEGGRTKVRFTGLDSERVGIEGTILDIGQRPQFYDLTDEMRTFIAEWQIRQSKFQQDLIQGYGAKVGEFTVPEGSVFLSSVDRGTEMLAVMRQTEEQAIRQGRGGTRVFEVAADRMKVDPDFNPVTDIRKLMSGMDEWRATVAGNEVFKQGIGGKTLVEVVAEKHPDLLKLKTSLTSRINNLKSRLTTAESQITDVSGEANRISQSLDRTTRKAEPLLNRIEELGDDWGPELSFLSGQVRELLQQAANLERRGGVLTEKGVVALERRSTILTDINELSPQLDQVRRRYADADLRPFQFVQEGIFRYFPADEARAVRELSKFNTNHWVSFLDNMRGGIFAGDLSPIAGVQLPLSFLFQPHRAIPRLVGAGKNSVQSRDLLNIFRESTMREAVEANPQLARDFAFFSGFPVQTGAPREFAGGFLRFIPGFQVANERMYSVVLRQSFDLFDNMTQRLAKSGIVGDEAKVVAADMATKVFPMWNPARLGLSQSRAATIRALPTSVSFILQPAALVGEATTGFAKIAVKQTLTSQEKMAVQLMTTIAGSVMSLSITTAAMDALARGNDPIAAIKAVINPADGKFASIFLVGTGRRLPLGGPFRGIIKAIVPREVDWAPVPIPFANIGNFFVNRINPFLGNQVRQLRNRDFFGGEIRKGELPEQILRGLAFAVEGNIPLVGGTVASGIRRGLDPGGIVEETAAQVLGTNLAQETPFQQRDLTVQRWARENGIERGQVFQLTINGETIEVDQSQKIESFYDLVPSDRGKFERENPGVVEAIKKETKRRADQGIEFAVTRQRVEDLKDESAQFQLADDALLNSRQVSPTEWISRRKERRSTLNDQREVIYSNLDPRDPKTVLDYYFAQFDKIKEKFNGIMTNDAWEELELWVASQSAETQEYIDANTGLSPLTLKEQEYKDDLKILRPYWDQKDIIIDGQNPEIQRIYRGAQDLSEIDRTKMTTPLAGDSEAVRARKERNRLVINFVDNQINKVLTQIRLSNSAIRGALIKWEYNVSKQLIQIQSIEEAVGAR